MEEKSSSGEIRQFEMEIGWRELKEGGGVTWREGEGGDEGGLIRRKKV